MRKKIIISGIFLMLLGLSLILYENFSSETKTSGNKLRTTVDTTKVKIGIIPYPTLGLFYVAKHQGYFKEENVDAEIVTFQDENQLIPSMISNEVQFLPSSPDFIALASEAGLDATQVLCLDIGFGSDALIVEKSVVGLSDLRDKKIYLSVGTPSYFLFRKIIEEQGLTPGNFKFVNMPGDQVGSGILAGKISYGMTWEPWISKIEQQKAGKVLFSSRTKPGIIADTIMVRKDFLASDPHAVEALIKAYFKAVDFYRSNPESSNSIIAKSFGMEKSEIEAMMKNVKPFGLEENLKKFDISADLNLYQLTQDSARIYQADGLLKNKIYATGLIDKTPLLTISKDYGLDNR